MHITNINYNFAVPPIRSITCSQAFYNDYGGSFASHYLSMKDLVQMVRCPTNCGSNSYSYSRYVYGTTVYTDVSSICRAAIHDGKITSKSKLQNNNGF